MADMSFPSCLVDGVVRTDWPRETHRGRATLRFAGSGASQDGSTIWLLLDHGADSKRSEGHIAPVDLVDRKAAKSWLRDAVHGLAH
jgi:hypothetical protein